MTAAELPRAGVKSIWINPAVPRSTGDKFSPNLFCYAVNSLLSINTEKSLKMNRVEHPAATIFMGEKTDALPNLTPASILAYFGGGDPAKDPNSGANFLFCDGHVSLVLRKNFDPTLGATSMVNNPPNSSFTFAPYDGA